MFIDRIEDADGNLAQVTGRLGGGNAGKRGLGTCRMGEHFTPGNGGRQQAARGSQKLAPADGGVLGSFLHARLLGKRSNGVGTNISAALYDDARVKQSLKIVFLMDSCGRREAKGNRCEREPPKRAAARRGGGGTQDLCQRTGKVEDAKLPEVRIAAKQCPTKCAAEKGTDWTK